jgi:hypothetical protein
VIQYNLLEHYKTEGTKRHQGLHKVEKIQESKGKNDYKKEGGETMKKVVISFYKTICS